MFNKSKITFENESNSDDTETTSSSDNSDSEASTKMEGHIKEASEGSESKVKVKTGTSTITAEDLNKALNATNCGAPQEMERLLEQRMFARGHVTRLYNKIKGLFEAPGEEEIDFANIDGIMTNLTHKFEQLKMIENDIQRVSEIGELDKEIESFSQYEQKYEEVDVTGKDE